MDDGVAPRSRFSSFSPVFPVRDLRRALAHYASLGFEVEPYADGDGDGYGYGFAERDEVSLHLSLDEGHGPEADHQHVGTAYLYVGDADALYDEWARPGVGGLTRRVGDRPYKLREGSHIHPDGNLIRFGSPMPGRPGERLRAHLETRYGITVDAMTQLDLGVWRVGRAEGPDWVARWFPARRPADAVAGDAAILRYLAAHEFPAERCAADEPASVLDGRSVLVTEWADPVSPAAAAGRDPRGGRPQLPRRASRPPAHAGHYADSKRWQRWRRGGCAAGRCLALPRRRAAVGGGRGR